MKWVSTASQNFNVGLQCHPSYPYFNPYLVDANELFSLNLLSDQIQTWKFKRNNMLSTHVWLLGEKNEISITRK